MRAMNLGTQNVRALGFALLATAMCVTALAQDQSAKPATGAANNRPRTTLASEKPLTPPEAQALVRNAIDRQMEADEKGGGPSFRYILKENGKRGILTKEMIETKDGIIARLIAINDRPVTAEERKADDDRLNKLMRDSQARQQKAKQQQEDDKRTRKMVRALPDAFVYEFEGREEGPRGPVVRLRFKPNPDYDPPSRELQVYQGMAGHMLIDPRAGRLVEIDAKLFRDVNFGWGILGHLEKGGEFMVHQSDVTGNDDWQITAMRLRFDGKVLIFKPIHIRDDDTATNFRVVPNDLNFAQGLELLKKQDAAIAGQK